MTGLPPVAPSPPAVPPADAVAQDARAWLEVAAGCAEAGSATVGALRRSAVGWNGPAAASAADRARALRDQAVTVSDAGLAGAAAVARFAHRLRLLARERTRLLTEIDREASTLAHLALEPDARPDAPSVRLAAWERHERLMGDLTAWHHRHDEAADELVAALARPHPRGSHVELLDSAHRALLALDDSPAATATRRALREGDDTLLLDFDPAAFDGDGSVVIAHGDPSTADHVAVVVPGMTTDATSVGDVSAMAVAVAGAAARRAGRSTASIAWVGYDAPADGDLARGKLRPHDLPDIARVADERAAEVGGDELVRFVDGLADRDVTVVGHSYGATTAAHAAVDGMVADRLVLLGSPGAGADAVTADGLRLPTWVAAHDLDPVTWIGGTGPLGVDPAHHEFGAVRLPTDPVRAPHLDEIDEFVAIHAGYLAPGTASLDAVASVVVGERPTSVPARTASGAGLAADWLAGQAAYEVMSWR